MEKIHPQEAKALREAFRQTRGKTLFGSLTDDVIGGRAEVIGVMSDDRIDCWLIVYKDDDGAEALGAIPVNNGMLKRLKRELGFWEKVRSGSAMATRHGNFQVGKA